MVHAGGDGQLELAARAAEPDAVDRRILRRDLDRDRIDVRGDRPGRGPQPQRGEGEQAGAGADIGEIGECARRPPSAGRARSGSRSWSRAGRCRRRGRRRSRSATASGRDRVAVRGRVDEEAARRGSAPGPAWLSVTQSSSPSFSTAGRVPRALGARREQQVEVGAARAPPRNRRPSATPRRPPRWSSAPAATSSAANWAMSPFSASASALVQGRVTFQVASALDAGATRSTRAAPDRGLSGQSWRR